LICIKENVFKIVDGIYFGHFSAQWETAVFREVTLLFHLIKKLLANGTKTSFSKKTFFSRDIFATFCMWMKIGFG
jgi:hypothetical protein